MSSSRRKGGAWIVTFGDLMALLLTFFVLLLSFSEIDAKKYETLIESFGRAFSGKISLRPGPPTVPAPNTGGGVNHDLTAAGQGESYLDQDADSERTAEQAAVQDAFAEFESALDEAIKRGVIAIDTARGNVVIRFEEGVSFPSGSADIVPSFATILDRIAAVMKRMNGDIVVSGHTDDRPISTPQFRSNWDLSSARAVSVVHYLTKKAALSPSQIVAQGRADSAPLVPNDGDGNRKKNRRVEISIQPKKD